MNKKQMKELNVRRSKSVKTAMWSNDLSGKRIERMLERAFDDGVSAMWDVHRMENIGGSK